MSRRIKKDIYKKVSTVHTVVLFLLLTTLTTVFVFQNEITKFLGATGQDARSSSEPRFIFDTDKFPDWASPGNVHSDSGPIAAVNVSQCTEGSHCSTLVEKCRMQSDESNQSCQKLEQYTVDGCMVHSYYFNTLIDSDAAVADQLEQWNNFGTNPEKVGPEKLTMSTPDGNIEYVFHQYDTRSSDKTYKKGSAFGFIPLSTGHIRVQGVCWEASQLDTILPILNAIRLEV